MSCFEQERQGLTGCFVDMMCSASGRATPGLLSQLAVTRREILPSSVNKPWAGSNSYKISELMSFIAERPLPVDSPSLPFWVRFNELLRIRRQHYGFTHSYTFAATLDTGPLAKSYPRGSLTRLSSTHFQSARAFFCYRAFVCVLVFGEAVRSRVDATAWQRNTQCLQTGFRYGSTCEREFCEPIKLGQFSNGFVRDARAIVEM